LVSVAGFSFLLELEENKKVKKNKLAQKNLDMSGAYYWYKQLFEVVIGAFCGNWMRFEIRPLDFETNSFVCRDPRLVHRPISVRTVNEKRLEAAHDRYLDSANGRDIAVACHMESSPDWIYVLFQWNSSAINRNLVVFVVAIHLSLTFFEPSSISSLKTKGLKTAPMIIECFCIIVELQDAISKAFLLFRNSHVKNAVDNIKSKLKDQLILLFIILAVLVDLILTVKFRFSFEYYVPIKFLIVLLEIVEVR
jgi:hypothetical protein